MGASMVGFALPLLDPAMQSSEAVIRKIEQYSTGLKKAMLLAGAGTLDQLKDAKIGANSEQGFILLREIDECCGITGPVEGQQ